MLRSSAHTGRPSAHDSFWQLDTLANNTAGIRSPPELVTRSLVLPHIHPPVPSICAHWWDASSVTPKLQTPDPSVQDTAASPRGTAALPVWRSSAFKSTCHSFTRRLLMVGVRNPLVLGQVAMLLCCNRYEHSHQLSEGSVWTRYASWQMRGSAAP